MRGKKFITTLAILGALTVTTIGGVVFAAGSKDIASNNGNLNVSAKTAVMDINGKVIEEKTLNGSEIAEQSKLGELQYSGTAEASEEITALSIDDKGNVKELTKEESEKLMKEFAPATK